MKTRIVDIEGEKFTIAKATIDAWERFEAYQAQVAAKDPDASTDQRARAESLALIINSLQRAGSTDATVEALRQRLSQTEVFGLCREVLRFSGATELPPGESASP